MSKCIDNQGSWWCNKCGNNYNGIGCKGPEGKVGQQMKIVRITLSAGQSKFFFDRPFEEGKSDFDSCDNALKFLTQLYEEQKVLAVMLMQGGGQVVEDGKARNDPFLGAIPAMVNLKNISMLVIENAGVYDIAEQKVTEVTAELVDE